MIIGIFGNSCTGKSSIANKLKEILTAEVYTGKDYLRLAKSETEAVKKFKELLSTTTDKTIVYVISEKEHLTLLPENALRVLVTSDLNKIKERFAKRLNRILPPPLAKKLESSYGIFDTEPCNIKITNNDNLEENINKILEFIPA